MANEDIKAELLALREEVAALVASRKPVAAEKPVLGSSESPVRVTVADTGHEGLVGHVGELVELLEHEVKESPVAAGVAVFALGVLVGRFLR